MNSLSTAILLLAVPGLPLLLAALPGRRLGVAFAPLPALLAVFALPTGTLVDLPWLLLGTRLGLDALGVTFLAFTALLWAIAGWQAAATLAEDPRRERFLAFFLLSQAGSLGLIVAQDPATFFTLFAVMGLAAYGLVVHRGDAGVRRAGRLYLGLTLVGEVALLSALVLSVRGGAAQGMEAVAVAPLAGGGLAVALVMLGFGIKVGALPVHVWMPLAYPAAPAVGSAVLAGAMVNAGLLGWLRWLPLGEAALPQWGGVLVVLGLAGAFYGVLVGVVQREPKAVLAYSSVSQMGAMTAVVGLGLLAPALWSGLLAALLTLAVHHGLAKGSLFLGVGVLETRGARPWVLAGLALGSLALAGAPLTAGAVAKGLLKGEVGGLPAPWSSLLPWLLPLATAATTVLMARFLWLARGSAPTQAGPSGAPTWALSLAAVAALPWLLDPGSALSLGNLPAILAGVLAAAVVMRWRPAARWVGRIPPGDLIALGPPLARLARRWAPALPRPSRPTLPRLPALHAVPAGWAGAGMAWLVLAGLLLLASMA
jgi:hydrogenase-4 component B